MQQSPKTKTVYKLYQKDINNISESSSNITAKSAMPQEMIQPSNKSNIKLQS